MHGPTGKWIPYLHGQTETQKHGAGFYSEGILKAAKQKKLAVLFGVEGGHMIENDLNKLDALYNRGARYMTLTWNNSTDWASSALDETTKADSLKHKGLTDFGKQVVKRMNEMGMLVDLSMLVNKHSGML